MNKSQQVADFIRINNPRRKEIIKHLLVNINGTITEDQYDNLKPNDSLHAFWSTNFAKWKRVGTVEVIGGKYKLTDLYNGSLYTTKVTPIKASQPNKELENKVKHWKKRYWDMVEQRQELLIENNAQTEKLNALKDLFELW